VDKDAAAVELRWTNAAGYDQVVVYRDGLMLAQVDGAETLFVDSTAGVAAAGDAALRHEYTVRGLIDDSRSLHSNVCRVELADEPPALRFLRGDCNGDGRTDGVGDAVTMLSRNFLGGVEVGCAAACDANGDGATSGVTDAVTILSNNLIGSVRIPPPYPACGDSDLPSDELLGCERQAAACE
jgi:hypothetical protein